MRGSPVLGCNRKIAIEIVSPSSWMVPWLVHDSCQGLWGAVVSI